ncbi:hypothetical protein [Nonomuraea basaltis]|uniref:hypothetical protein n=1 Tax=Nonomuraea basaltis TaxID=2495887 RepID=UPI00110C4187|nr:hypothetical protein [Nonomuraea basaltis]TMR99622.1 hypothetical protein EJK15_06090 [Nonomuraea basaltis]
MVDEVVEPYLADLARRARVGAHAAALEIGLGLVAGLYACREEKDNELALVHAALPDVVDHQADRVLKVLDKNDLMVPEGWMDDHCPAWA